MCTMPVLQVDGLARVTKAAGEDFSLKQSVLLDAKVATTTAVRGLCSASTPATRLSCVMTHCKGSQRT